MEQEKLIDYLKKVSPGMSLRTVIDDLLRGGLGALIVFYKKDIDDIIEGGFRVNCKFTSQKLFELAKMDGAIIVSSDLKKIIAANVVLTPDSSIYSAETGTRHKAAERTAKQAETFVIAVSERKKKTTLYFNKTKYYLKSLGELLRDVTSNLQILEKQREIFNELVNKLNILEMSELVSVSDVCKVLQRGEMVMRISDSLKRNFTELGKEGYIMHIRFREVIKGVEKTNQDIIRDYSSLNLKKTKTILENLSYDGLLNLDSIARMILEKQKEESLSPKGFRFLERLNLQKDKIPHIVRKFTSLNNLFSAESKEFEFILKSEAGQIKEEINTLREKILEGAS